MYLIYVGGACLIIEVSYPSSLLSSILEDTNPKAIITKKFYENRFNGQKLIILDVNWYESSKISLDDSFIPEKCELDDILMVVFSSGTTGKPKGKYLLDLC